MTIGERIRAVRKEKHLTQKQLGELLGVTQATVGQYETTVEPPKIETLSRIANALKVPLTYLIVENRVTTWDLQLDEKLSHVGCSIGFYEEDAYIWINYPDGTLEVTEAQLNKLNNDINDYIKYRLEDLKKQNFKDFIEQK